MRVLFVCVENSCRSQMAEGFAKHVAKERGDNYLEAASAGSRPSGVVNPKAIASMREVGIDISVHKSKALADFENPADPNRWDYAVTMGCGDECPNIDATHREDWDITDPKHMDPAEFAEVRDEIRDRVRDLIRRSSASPN